MVERQMTQLKSKPQKGVDLSRSHPWNLQWDKDATGNPNTYVFDPTDVQIHEFFFEGTPNPKDLEGVEEEKILAIQRTFQQKLKERDAERERNITKKDTRI